MLSECLALATLNRDDHSATRFFTDAVITVAYSRVEICCIPRFQFVLRRSDCQFEVSRDHVKQFSSRMLVRSKSLRGGRFKFCIVGIELSLVGIEIKTFEVVRDRSDLRIIGEPHALFLANDSHHLAFAYR